MNPLPTVTITSTDPQTASGSPFPVPALVHSVDSVHRPAEEENPPSQIKLIAVPPYLTAPASETASHPLNAAETLTRYVNALKSDSWCIDTSGFPVKAFHCRSSRYASLEHFQATFPSWAKQNGIRVEGDLGTFVEKLPRRLVNRLPKILGAGFRPVPEQFYDTHNGISLANTYVPYRPVRQLILSIPSILEEYFDRVFMNTVDREMVLDWCADIIQNPHRRPEWGVIMAGEQGTGKSTIATLVKNALGHNHVWQRDKYSLATDRFSEVLPDNLLVCFDDAVPKPDTYETLKFSMSAKTLPVETKYVQKVVQREIYARILICTNRSTPFDFDGQDRRFYVCEPSKLKVDLDESGRFFEEFYRWVSAPGMDEFFYNFFMNRDLSRFKHGSTTQTPALRRMLGQSVGDFKDVLTQLVRSAPRFHNERLLRTLKQAGCENVLPDSIVRVMKGLGYKHARRSVPECRTLQVGVWQPDAPRSPKLTPREIAAIQLDDAQEGIRLGLVQVDAD